MSWDQYVTNMEGEGCKYSGFFDQQGNKWGESRSPCMKIEPTQIDSVAKVIKTSQQRSGQGVMLGDRKFMVIEKTDDMAVMKQLKGEPSEKLMACVKLTKTGVCVGAAAGENEKVSRASCERIAKYLTDCGM